MAENDGMGMRPWERVVVIASPACFLLLWFPLASLFKCGLDQHSHTELPLEQGWNNNNTSASLSW